MAKVLSDQEVKKLLGTVIVDGTPDNLNPNGYELRLGSHVRFYSTGEEKTLGPDKFLKISPGETIAISSLESINLTKETVGKLFPGCMMMGLITPTTTMMREGISQVSTKIDAGFRGVLNWGLRNGSTRDVILQYGEPMFKLTIFLLEGSEKPEIEYGGRKTDHYQNSKGIVRSARRLPTDIPKSKIISSSFGQLDPRKQLREAGYPFDHISTELTTLHGKFEVVSKDVLMLKEQFESRTHELSGKIEAETRSLGEKMDELKRGIVERMEHFFTTRFLRTIGILASVVPIVYGAVRFLQFGKLRSDVQGLIGIAAGAALLILILIFTRHGHS